MQPSIFGSLLEGGLGHDQQWALGAHYTHEADIQKVVQPTIVQPWLERIDVLARHKDAVAAHYDLLNYVVLDPACGSGNFLYVAYRELRRLEVRLLARLEELRQAEGRKEVGTLSLFPLSNLKGIEIDGFAVALARVTLWMGHKLAVDELALAEPTLPLADLSGIRVGDALRMEWPRADAIIGNPPFHGSQHMRRELGDEYIGWLERQFRIGVKDYCVYWFRKAHDHLQPGQRSGLVGTNSIAQNRARSTSLDYIVEHGGIITSAVSSQPWPGEAAVNVSIVNWVRSPAFDVPRIQLDGVEVPGVTTSLRVASDVDLRAERLAQNAGRAFQGPQPVGSGFLLSIEEAQDLIRRADASYGDVVRPYLVGEDIVRNPSLEPSRYIIDFVDWTLEEAMRYPAALEIVRARVKPERDQNRRKIRRERWWCLGETVPAMRAALTPLQRYIAMSAVSKRFLFIWCDPAWCPSNRTNVFALDRDDAMGVLASSIHVRWGLAQSGTHVDRPFYTPSSAFTTFPWPDADLGKVADLSRRLYARRSEICLERQIGLTKLYNQVDDGAWRDLRDLHIELDEAVAAAYGWPRSAAHDQEETNRRLLELNRQIAAGEREYSPFPLPSR